MGEESVARRVVTRGASIASSLAVAVWLGGLVALGALTAPIVFRVAPMPQSADAMTLIFRRFDMVAMACASLVLASEAARIVARVPFAKLERARLGVGLLAAIVTTYQASQVSPRIAELHASGAVRGVGAAGLELSRLHDTAELCGKATVVLLVALVVLHALTSGDARRAATSP